jgi:hypothetical protein
MVTYVLEELAALIFRVKNDYLYLKIEATESSLIVM